MMQLKGFVTIENNADSAERLAELEAAGPTIRDLIEEERAACPFRPEKIYMSLTTWQKLRRELEQDHVFLFPSKPNGLPVNPHGSRYGGLEIRILLTLPYGVIKLAT